MWGRFVTAPALLLMDSATPTHPFYPLVQGALRHAFDGRPAARRWAVAIVYITLAPFGLMLSIVVADGNWMRIAVPKVGLMGLVLAWLVVRKQPRTWEWLIIVGIFPAASFMISQIAAGPRSGGAFVPNALVFIAVLCVAFDGLIVATVALVGVGAYAIVQFHFHSPLEATAASGLFMVGTAVMVALVHGGAAYLREALRRVTELHGEMLLAADNERGRIAGELHDDAIQVLIAAGARLDEHGGRLSRGQLEGAAESVASVREMIGQAVDRTRRLSFDLYPAELDARGLGAALEALAREVESEASFAVTVSGCDTRYPREFERLAYRAAKELLTNAKKHSRANHVEILFVCHPGSITCVVQDDGVGFAPAEWSAARRNLHIGLDSTTDRLRLAGGRLAISAEPGRGTRAQFTIPAPASRRPAA